MAVYIVRPGDTLVGIATTYHTSVQAILQANPGIHNPNLISVGQRLEVATAQPLPPSPPAPVTQVDPPHPGANRQTTVNAIAAECRRRGLGLNAQIAYVLATTEHETAHTFQPVREAFWLSEAWRRTHLRYYPYYGRGYVQLTWYSNYLNYGRLLGIDLAGNPDLAMVPENALFILVHGMQHGAFTGRRLDQYVNASHTDFYNARRVVNGLDAAQSIATLAQNWLRALGG